MAADHASLSRSLGLALVLGPVLLPLPWSPSHEPEAATPGPVGADAGETVPPDRASTRELSGVPEPNALDPDALEDESEDDGDALPDDEPPLTGTDDAIPIVRDLAQALALSPPLELLPRRKWIKHRVRPRERIDQIAARYGVRRSDVLEWNALEADAILPPPGRRTLKVQTRRVAPPRLLVGYVPTDGESWSDIAARFRVEGPDLRAWNWRARTLRPGVPVQIWVDPGLPFTLRPGEGPPPDPPVIPDGARSVGRPQQGRIDGAVRLPPSELYRCGSSYVMWGSSHALRQIVAALATFRHQSGYEGTIVIGALSRKHGRRLRPHVSHQSGRDVDIRLPLLPGIPVTHSPNPDEVDWLATWMLVKAFVETGEVSRIFLDTSLHRRLYEAARSLGATREELRAIIQWPSWTPKEDPVVRHEEGHDGHIHVRIDCGDDEPRCL